MESCQDDVVLYINNSKLFVRKNKRPKMDGYRRTRTSIMCNTRE